MAGDLLDLTVREGNGLDSMLWAALKRRPEVAAVDMHDGCIEMEYRPEYCQQPDHGSEPSGLRLKDILPLLKDNAAFLCQEEADGYVMAGDLRLLTKSGQEDYAALLNARVASIGDSPEGTEVFLTDVDPQELARFSEAYDAFREAEQAMGPVM